MSAATSTPANAAPGRVRALAHPLLPCAWLVGIPTFLVLANDSLAALPVLNGDRIVLALIVGALAARALVARGSFGRAGALDLALALYAAVLAAAWIAGPSPGSAAALRHDGAIFLDGVLMPCVAYAAVRHAAWTPRRASRALLVLGIGLGAFLAAAGFLEQIGFASLAPRALPREHPFRVSGPFSNSVQYGLVACQLLCVCLFAALSQRGRGARALIAAVAGGLLFAAFVCRSRAVWLSLPLSVAFLAPRLRALAPVLAGALAVLAALWIAAAALASTTADAGWGGRLLLAGPGGRGDLAARAGDVASLESHLAASEAALAMIASRPLTGFGFGSEIFAEQKWRHRPRWSFTDPAALAWPGTPHDSLLYLGVAAGLPGIAAGLAVLAAVWQSLRRARRGPPPQSDLALCVRAAFVVTLMNALFVDLVFFVYAQILLFALVGLVASGALVPRPVPD